MTYRVYEAFLYDGTAFRFCCSALREISLRQDIAAGKLLMEIGSLIHETTDRNAARAMAPEM